MRRVFALVVSAVLGVSVISGCVGSGGPETLTDQLRIATGSLRGVAYPYGRGVAAVVSRELPGVEVTVIQTAGSKDNLAMLRDGSADVGFTLADSAADAMIGEGTRIVTLARLYDNEMQLVVRADGPIEAITDLRGRRVSTGALGSGGDLTAMRLLEVSGLAGGVQRLQLPIAAAIEALERQEIDAFFWAGGLPGPPVAGLNSRVPLRLLDIHHLTSRMRQDYGDFYYETSIPVSIYGLERPVRTMAVPSYLVVSESMPEELAYQLTKLLFTHQDELAEGHPEGQRLNLRSAIATYPVPLHPGAQRYYREAHR